MGLGLEILENSFLESFGHDFYACRFRFLKDVLTKITTFGLAADRFLDIFWVRFLIDFGYRLRSPLGGLDEIRVAFWSALKVVFLRQGSSKSAFLHFCFKMQDCDFHRTSRAKSLLLLMYTRCLCHRFPQKW